MPAKENRKLEACIDNALRRQEFCSLQEFLQKESSSQKCSKELLVKLDQLVSRELDKADLVNASLLLNVIHKCSKSATSTGEEWLTAAIKQGLVEKIRNILVIAGNTRNKALLTITEDYLDVVMVSYLHDYLVSLTENYHTLFYWPTPDQIFNTRLAVHDHNSDGNIKILENFLLRMCCLVGDASISIFIKQEVVRKLNQMLDTVPREAKKRLILTQVMMAAMSAMGKQILEAGDFDLQVAIIEALCRMTSESQRRELASQWFPMEFITNAFKEIKDSEFETDCRKFLNLVNGMRGDKRRVFAYPCISAHLDNHKFQTPSDEKLDEFWIDFNVGTQSISFYVSTNNSEDNQWETACITESEVGVYNVEETNNRKLLTVTLNTPLTVGQVKGSQIRIYFSSALDISNVIRKVFGASKCKDFVRKKTLSVAETAVHIIFDESSSQILIPESQGSIASSKEVTATDTGDVGMKKHHYLSTPSLIQQLCKENRNPAKLVTPSHRKVSEASINISLPRGLKTVGSSASTKSPTLGRGRMKPPLKMMSSSKRNITPVTEIKDNTKQITSVKKITSLDKTVMQANENDGKLSKGDEPVELVPDTQYAAGDNSLLLPGLGSKKKHPMSTRRKEKISVTGGCISNAEKAYDIADKPETVSETVGKTAQNPTAKVTTNQKIKAQTSYPCQSTKQENLARTEVKERSMGKPASNHSSYTEKASCKSIQKPETPLRPETEKPKDEITETAKFRPPKYATKRKDLEEMENEKDSGKDAAKTLVRKTGNKAAVKRKQEDTSFRQNLKKTLKQTNKEKNQTKTTKKGKKLLSVDKVGETRDDVYSFNSKGSDEPMIELGISSMFISKHMVNFAVTKSGTSSMKKDKSKKETDQKLSDPRKHLFSDTDTERGGDDSKTEISWLRDPGSKRKPNVVGYGRQRPGNPPKEKTVSRKAADYTKPSRRVKASVNKESCDIRLSRRAAEEASKRSKFRLPPRGAAGKRKNISESSNSESESVEEPKPPSRKQTPKYHGHRILRTKREQKKLEHPGPTKIHKKPFKMDEETVNTKKISAHVSKKLASPACSSPDSVEQMRSEYESDTELAIKHSTITHSSPSLSGSPPEQRSPEESMNISVDLQKACRQWTELSDKSASRWAKSTLKTGKKQDTGKTAQEPLAPACSRALQNTFTLDNSTVSGINALEVRGHEQRVRMCPSVGDTSKTGVYTTKKKAKDSNAPSFSSAKTSSCNTACVNIHQSGPTLDDTISYIKRINKERGHHADVSTDGSDHEVQHKKIKLRPRKLFPSPDTQEPAEHLSNVSGNNTSTAATDTWDGNSSDVGKMCKQIGKEFSRKSENRSKKMDYFTKQSLKSAQNHFTSVDVQVQECRIMHLEKFHQTLLEEMESYEKDSQALKQMEKEFANFWSKQKQVFNLYCKNEQRRVKCLKASLEMNVSHSKDNMEKIFNSEMQTMKKNMKAVQERLLKEMQEEELLSVRRGLQSLFMSGDGPF